MVGCMKSDNGSDDNDSMKQKKQRERMSIDATEYDSRSCRCVTQYSHHHLQGAESMFTCENSHSDKKQSMCSAP